MGRSEQHARVRFRVKPSHCSDVCRMTALFPERDAGVAGARHQMAKATANAIGTTTRPR
jgi:hypothetical protein